MKKTKKKKKNQKLVPFLVGVLMVTALFSCLEDRTEVPPATEPTTIVTEAPDPTEPVTELPTEVVTEATEPPATDPPTEAPTEAPTEEPTKELQAQKGTYVLNTNPSSMKFHYPTCRSVDKMKESNKLIFEGTREEVIAKGYSPCGNCHP